MLDPKAVRRTLVGVEELDTAIGRARTEVEARVEHYRGGRPPLDTRGRTAIVVDDGLGTGETARAALRAVRAQGLRRLVLAVTVGAPETVHALRDEANVVVCVLEPETIWGSACGKSTSGRRPTPRSPSCWPAVPMIPRRRDFPRHGRCPCQAPRSLVTSWFRRRQRDWSPSRTEAARAASARTPVTSRGRVARRAPGSGRRLAATRPVAVLLIVGGRDTLVLERNREAQHELGASCALAVVPGATHRLEEPGALDEVSLLAGDWFEHHLVGGDGATGHLTVTITTPPTPRA